ncbi:WD40 repeat domain-containing serine/threonine protein kinase [Hyalangium versicolor]|uniref:WD40 repeat domain-containing serine/threonine protein kinase n=1 Tax=Hyalangium versicolor TaxID=2861190 RepID=UPI001CCD6FFC|nr:serine/threonine-protein kinase [Hyalangium versicolor]
MNQDDIPGGVPPQLKDDSDPSVESTLTFTGQKSVASGSSANALTEQGAERYELSEEFAHGGIGRILRARDLRLSRPVAIKELLLPHGDADARFVAEAFITARLQHPAIVPVYDAGRKPSGEPFFAMKLVSGRSLADVIALTKTLEERLALLPHVLAVAEAIAYAHTERIIHRDLKPANVLVGPFGETVVIDWGLAKDLAHKLSEPVVAAASPGSQESDLTLRGAVMGTPTYMPPEQALGHPVDERADVYALGAILYHLLAGTKPYDSGSSQEVLAQVVQGPPEPLDKRQRGIPADLLAIVAKAMSREPAGRYATARELAEDLRRFETGQIVRAHEYSWQERGRRFARRHRAVVAVTAVALLVLTGIGTVSILGIMAARDQAELKQAEAEQARQEALMRADELILQHARSAVERNPNAAIDWLRSLSSGFTHWSAVRTIAADAQARGFATVLRGHHQTVNEVLFLPDSEHVLSSSDDYTVRIWSVKQKKVERVLSGHSDEVWHMALAPQGELLATGSKDRTLRLWDLATGQSRPPLSHAGPVDGMAFTPDGRQVITTCRGDDLLHVWDVATGTLVRAFKTGLGPLSQFELSRDGRYALVRALQSPRAQLWDLEHGTSRMLEHGGTVVTLAISPRGDLAATGALDETLHVWDLRTGQGRVLGKQPGSPFSLAFSPDGTRLGVGSAEGQLLLWNLGTGQNQLLGGHEGRISQVRFSRDGNLLATSSDDRSARLWDLTTGQSRVLRGPEGSAYALALSPDERWVAVGSYDTTVRLFAVNTEANRILAKSRASLHTLLASPDGQHLAAMDAEGALHLLAVGSGTDTLLEEISTRERPALQFSPDGQWLAVGKETGPVRLWNMATGQLSRQLEGHTAAVTALLFRRDGLQLATADAKGGVRLWELGSGQARALESHEREVCQLAFSPDGQRLASGSTDGEIQLWNLATGTFQALRDHGDAVRHLIFSPDGQRLISASLDHTLRIWDLATGGNRRTDISGSGVQQVLLSQDGELLISASLRDSSLRLWDARTGAARGMLSGHQGEILAMALSPDGRRVASASQDRTVRLWDLATHESRVLRGHAQRVTGVIFLNDRELVSSGWDGTVRLWLDDLPSDPLALRQWMEAVVNAPSP